MARLLDRLDFHGLEQVVQDLSKSDPKVSETWTAVVANLDVQGSFPASSEIAQKLEIESDKIEAWLKLLHNLILEMDIVSADMVCNGCNHIYRITDGIPNMLLETDEV
jgi:uncharacterized protein YbaR (Trm112 family)